MTELLAPNGKRSNLSPEQYKLVRTPAFKEWFGDWENLVLTKINDSGIDEISLKRLEDGVSKIVHSNGEPLPVYHGTNAETFVVFDGGSFFTDDYMNADGYASGEMVYEVFLNIKKPLIINARGRKWDNLKNKYGNSTRDIVGQLDFEKYNGVIFNNINDNWFDDEMGDTQNVYFSINPNQIKLADGSNTTFDGNNPDIRFDEGGGVKELSKKEKQEIISNQNKFFGDGLPTYKLSADGNWVMKLDSRTNKYKTYQMFDLFYESILEQKIQMYARKNSNKVFEYLDSNGAELLNKSIYGSRYYIYKNNYIRVSNHHNQTQQTNKETGLNKYKPNEHNFYSYEKDGWKEIISKIESLNNPDIRFYEGGEVIINPTEIECHSCHWKWKVKDGGDDLFICHKCYTNNTKYYKFEGLKGEKILDTITYEKGGKIDDKVGKEFWFEYHCFESDESCDSEIWYRSHQKVKVLSVREWSFDELQDRIDDGQPRVYSVKFNDGFIADVLEDELMQSPDEFYRPDPLKRMKSGGRTISQTPAPKKDQIKGSDKNKEGSAKDLTSAKKIKFADDVLEKIQNSVDKHNKKHSNKKISIDSAKAVVRRGMGAYSSTHRPTISGGNENSRVAWGLARLNAFMYKIVNGKSKSGKYSQDNDLIEELGYKVEKYEIGGIFQGTPYDFNAYSTEYIGTGEGLQAFGWGLYFTDIKEIAKNYAKNELLIQKEIVRKSEYSAHLWIYTNISDKVVDKLGYFKIKLKQFEELKKEYKKDIWDDKIKIYSTLIDIVQNYQGKIYSVTLFKGEKETDYDLIKWEKPLSVDNLIKIFNEAEKIGKIDFNYGWELDEKYGLTNERGYKVKGEEMYRWLSKQLGSDKEASLFLLRAGIDGIKYKSGTLSGMSDKEGYNYVIFDGDDVTIESKEKFADGGDVNNLILYHGTGNAKKVLKALKNNSFIFKKTAGVENGIYLTDNKSVALAYANDTKGDDIGVLKIKFKKIPNFKKYNNAGEQYDDETKYSWNPNEASIEYKKDLISNNYDGYSTEEVYVLFKEKMDLIDFDKNSILSSFVDGGDIQAYEEAMGISFAEGGEAKPKKVYVSIRLDNTSKKIPNTFMEYFNVYSKKPFEELKNGKLEGLVGVSSSPNNIAEWFILRDCLIVMDYDEFMAINETEIINYYDPYQLMKNNLYLFKRLYANISRYGEQEGSYVFKQTLVKILEKIIREINLEMNLAEGQKYSELYRISRFLSPYETRAFPDWIENNRINIGSPVDLTDAIIEFNKYNDSYLGQGFENSVLTFDELLPVVEKGITNASSIYDSEQEIVLNNRELNIPKNSQLFFIGKDEVGRERESNRNEFIEKYNLKELYKVYFVDAQQIQKYRDIWVKKEEKKFNQKIETGKQDLEIKKSQVTNNLIDYFIQHSIDAVIGKVNKEILSYESGSTEFYDSTKDDYEEINWVHIPLVDELFSKYTEIVEKSWQEIIKNKSVNQVNLYSFNVFQDTAYQNLKTYLEQNKDKYEELENYRNTKGRPSLQLSFFSYDLLKSLYDYEDLPEWINYKELSKMYLNKMGTELYRYYDKKDLPLISQYKNGGEADEPTEFWGTEAGGVLVYCSTTERYLILLRSEWVFEPNTWGIISGKLDDDETNIEDAVLRESEEETGHKLGDLIPSFIFEKPNFKFHNFVSIIEKEFVPILNWENTDYKWVKLNEMPDNLHFGLKLLLQKENMQTLVEKNKNNTMNKYNPKDEVTFNIPLLIRFAELMREEIKTDVALHEVIENLIDIKDKGTLNMDDYESIVGNVTGTEEDKPKVQKMEQGGSLDKRIEEFFYERHNLRYAQLNLPFHIVVNDIDCVNKIKEKYNKIEVIKIVNPRVKQPISYYLFIRNWIGISQLKNILSECYNHSTEYGFVSERQIEAYKTMSEKEFEEGGKVNSIKSKKGDIKISLDENWYSDDTKVELVPVSELIKFREFDRKVKPKYNQDNSRENINHLKFMFQKEGVKAPLIIEYSAEDSSVLIIEGNHRLNSAIDLGMEYLPARVVLKKHGKYSPAKIKNAMKVDGIKANSSNYIPSDLKPSYVGIAGAKPIAYAEGGIIEGRLHSECGDDGCGRKFQVGENGHIIEAERDEAVIVADAFNDNKEITIEGTPSEIASALNVVGGGKNFNDGAKIIEDGTQKEVSEIEKQATDTDVDDVIDSGSIIINRRSMADEKSYKVTGSAKQIASAINSINGNGVVIEKGAKIE